MFFYRDLSKCTFLLQSVLQSVPLSGFVVFPEMSVQRKVFAGQCLLSNQKPAVRNVF